MNKESVEALQAGLDAVWLMPSAFIHLFCDGEIPSWVDFEEGDFDFEIPPTQHESTAESVVVCFPHVIMSITSHI